MIMPDLETLQQYTELGIKLAAVYEYGDGYPYVEKDIKNRFTNDIEAIKKMIRGEYIFNETNVYKGTPIKLFRFIPNEADFLCLDIDNKNGVNGIKSIENISKIYNIDLKENFNKTTFVKTPNNGYHFYFKFKNENNEELKTQIDTGIEIKYKLALTAAGSVKGNKIYKLNGILENALPLPEAILKIGKGIKREPKEKCFDNKTNSNGYNPYLNYLPKLMNEAIQEATGHNERAYRFACKGKRLNYDPKIIKEQIFKNPDYFGKSQKNLLSTIRSAYHIDYI